jgi:hypothetical protein
MSNSLGREDNLSNQLPAALGAQTGALSLSVVQDTDTAFAITAFIQALASYRFLGDTGAVTIVGFYVDILGKQVTASVAITLSIPVQNATVTDSVVLTAPPAGAVGFIGNTTGALRYQIADSADAPAIADFKANPSRYPVMPAGNSVIIGKVAVV